VLKVTRNQGGAVRVTANIGELFERLILDDSSHHDTIYVNAVQGHVALVRIDPAPGDTTPAILYQLGDHLGSSEVETDTAGALVSREEFLPYGETSFGGYAKKRYRFTGKERDEESSLYYHGARYYAPWLSRWSSCDPRGLIDGFTLYAYARGSPLRYVDPSGRQASDPDVTGIRSAAPPSNISADIAMPGPAASIEELRNFAAAHPEMVGTYEITVAFVPPDPVHKRGTKVADNVLSKTDPGGPYLPPTQSPRPKSYLERLLSPPAGTAETRSSAGAGGASASRSSAAAGSPMAGGGAALSTKGKDVASDPVKSTNQVAGVRVCWLAPDPLGSSFDAHWWIQTSTQRSGFSPDLIMPLIGRWSDASGYPTSTPDGCVAYPDAKEACVDSAIGSRLLVHTPTGYALVGPPYDWGEGRGGFFPIGWNCQDRAMEVIDRCTPKRFAEQGPPAFPPSLMPLLTHFVHTYIYSPAY
jgi:RHS repeat-associated protein